SGLDIHYDLGEGHPLLGRRMPDLDLVTANGPLRIFTLLHEARPILLNLGKPGSLDISPWAQRVMAIDATYAGDWELPVLGHVAAPAAALNSRVQIVPVPPTKIRTQTSSSADRFLHERADPSLFGGSQLLQGEGDRPEASVVEVRRVVEAERRVPRAELLRALEETDD